METYTQLDGSARVILRKILKKPLRRIEFEVKCQISRVVRLVLLRIGAPITVSYNSSMSVDGTGAQLQRQATVMAVAKYFGFSYLHQDIKQVSVHPLDPFQTESEYQDYLVRLNNFLKVTPCTEPDPRVRKVNVDSLSFSFLVRECMMQVVHRRERYWVIYEPYLVTEFCPGIMDDLCLECTEYPGSEPDGDIYRIVVHYRQGVGGFALYPGQNIPREIPIEKFANRLASIVQELPNHLDWQVVVLTDAPEIEITYEPPKNQIGLWKGTPGFSDGVMTIKPTNFGVLEKYSKLPIRIIRGGNPLDAILVMASSSALLSGKSSLSYMGGLLNQNGTVYYPEDFWHRPLRQWRKI